MNKQLFTVIIRVLFLLFALSTLAIFGFSYANIQGGWVYTFTVAYGVLAAVLLVYIVVTSLKRFIKLSPKAMLNRLMYGLLTAGGFSILSLLLKKNITILQLIAVALGVTILGLFHEKQDTSKE